MKPSLIELAPPDYPLPDQPGYRREQIADWIFRRGAKSFQEMSNLPAALRAELEEKFQLSPVELIRVQGAVDTTQKLLWRLNDASMVESVLIPASPALYGDRSDRLTLCVSSQVGCAYGCRFCASGLDGWKRNLTPGEIVGQILAASQYSQRRINNLVFMGMGEPLANYANLSRALEIINSPWGLHIGARHITLSTSGLVPQIRALADDARQLRLAISLHGATDEVRSIIMPVNKKYPLAELMDACAYYQERKGRLITFEFILIEGVNDTQDQARALARLCRQQYAKVNLIPYNRVEGLPWNRPTDEVVRAFAETVKRGGATATVRLEKGHDIDAACGQLRLRVEKEQAAETKADSLPA